jgi:hypothetical protein
MQRSLLTKFLVGAIGWLSLAAVFAQDATRGKMLYETPFVAGQPSCSSGGCHASDPLGNQNRIRNGANPAAILAAINAVPAMRFLSNAVSSQARQDLAAYISNPPQPPVRAFEISPAVIDFANTTASTSSAARVIAVKNTGQTSRDLLVTSTNPDFRFTASTCEHPPFDIVSIIAPGETCLFSLSFVPRAVGTHTGSILVSSRGDAQVGQTVLVSGLGTPSTTLIGALKTMTEYRYVPLDYFFITSRENEKTLLDTIAGFERTGQSFSVYSQPESGTVAISRYYFDKVAKAGVRGSHFFTSDSDEKRLLLLLNPTNAPLPRLPYNEATEDFVVRPILSGSIKTCAAGLVPVYRLFRGNSRFPDDPNHRFTTSKTIYDDFVNRGWDGEGVTMCTPPTP